MTGNIKQSRKKPLVTHAKEYERQAGLLITLVSGPAYPIATSESGKY